MQGQIGDRVIVPGRHVGEAERHGEVLEVMGEGERRYRVRWDDGHEAIVVPGAEMRFTSPAEADDPPPSDPRQLRAGPGATSSPSLPMITEEGGEQGAKSAGEGEKSGAGSREPAVSGTPGPRTRRTPATAPGSGSRPTAPCG